MDIQIEGLTQRQRIIADVLWDLDSQEAVENFIKSLSGAAQQEAVTIMTLMIWAALDTVTETNLAEQVLERFK